MIADFTFKRGRDASIAINILEGTGGSTAAVTADLKKVISPRGIPPGDAAQIAASFAVSHEPAVPESANSPAVSERWVLSLTPAQTAALEASDGLPMTGLYAVDLKIEMPGGAVPQTETLLCQFEERVTV